MRDGSCESVVGWVGPPGNLNSGPFRGSHIMQVTLAQDTQKNNDTTVCDYNCLIGIETCPEMRVCEKRIKLIKHIKTRHNSHKNKALYKFFIDPPLEKDIAILFKESLNNGFCCKYCLTPLNMYATKDDITAAISLDHVIPLTNGGSNKLQNLQLICHRCNIVKNKTHPDYFDTITIALRDKYGVEGLNNFLNAIYPSLFADQLNHREDSKW
jgi:5-methylcytosine-specific restriction endonuclease McrA